MFATIGPSPRAWGLHRGKEGLHTNYRSIPTCVGFTLHEHNTAARWCGPSPRAWGLRSAARWSGHYCPVHPHVRGVYNPASFPDLPPGGPSPRAWGLRIPNPEVGGTEPVHPHVRGVYGRPPFAPTPCTGPSPRAWGLHFGQGFCVGLVRSIPTCVGFTFLRLRTRVLRTVHPHVRGVYLSLVYGPLSPFGPSPRAWGLLRGCSKLELRFRSIPTCVGFTHSQLTHLGLFAVHPHVRGVYVKVWAILPPAIGPSPRAWGLRVSKTNEPAKTRSIPTCVGFTPMPTM